jgi:hypothetical protein
MVMINIPENLAKVIEKAAQRENRSLDELAVSVLEEHFPVEAADETPDASEGVSALDALMGLFDDDVTDMSSNVKEHLREYYRNKNDSSD